ncbi:Hypothetical protein GbCGDNIH3_0476 [Granulibacter bethesdensis]|uniref:Uncharacterized protein n=2 Tax=Granulibacter bethesdensis TaxID=364410 RepID=A0AAN0VF32_9PROT|nr:Hypothetical protein GbCGDNIH3_0476 [Granulibacter bethesdensis]
MCRGQLQPEGRAMTGPFYRDRHNLTAAAILLISVIVSGAAFASEHGAEAPVGSIAAAKAVHVGLGIGSGVGSQYWYVPGAPYSAGDADSSEHEKGSLRQMSDGVEPSWYPVKK